MIMKKFIVALYIIISTTAIAQSDYTQFVNDITRFSTSYTDNPSIAQRNRVVFDENLIRIGIPSSKELKRINKEIEKRNKEIYKREKKAIKRWEKENKKSSKEREKRIKEIEKREKKARKQWEKENKKIKKKREKQIKKIGKWL